MRKIKTILVGQSGGPTAAINASLAGVIRTAYSHNLHILGMRNGIQGFLEGRVVDLTQALVLSCLNLMKTLPSISASPHA